MAIVADRVVVEVVANTNAYTAGIEKAERTFTSSMRDIETNGSRSMRRLEQGINSSITNVGNRITGLVPQISGITSALVNLGPAGIAAAAGLTAFALGMKQVFDTIIEREPAIAKLGAVLRATGYEIGITTEELLKMADRIESVTLFDDVQIIEAQSALLTFRNVSRDVFEEVLMRAADLSQLWGGDLQSSIRQLGRALEDPTESLGALRRAGIQFTDQQEALIKSLVETGKQGEALRIILDEIKSRVGGVATDTGTLTTAVNTLDDRWGNLWETLSKPFPDVLAGVISQVSNLILWLDIALQKWRQLPGAQQQYGEELGGMLGGMIPENRDVPLLNTQSARELRESITANALPVELNLRPQEGFRLGLPKLPTGAAAEQAWGDLGAVITGGGGGGGARAALEDLNKEFEEYLANLRQDFELSQMADKERAIREALISAEAAALEDYNNKLRDSAQLTDAEIAQVTDLVEQTRLLEGVPDIIDLTREAFSRIDLSQILASFEELKASLSDPEVLAALEAQGITGEQAAQAIDLAIQDAKDSASGLTETIEGVGNAIIGAAQQAKTLSEALEKIGLKLLEIAAQGLFGQGPAGGLFNDLFGGGKGGILQAFNWGGTPAPISPTGNLYQHGGSPPMGRAAIVGEAGPEVFVPKVPGTIIPNSAFSKQSGQKSKFEATINVVGARGNTEIMEMVRVGSEIAYRRAMRDMPGQYNEHQLRFS